MPVSIIVVTYRRPHSLCKTLESLLAQTYSDFEIIISDDASGDETEYICKEYRTKDKRIKYRNNSSNLGMPGNLNAAIKDCNYDLVVNCHDGDIYKPTLIGKWVRLMEKYPTIGFACCNFCETDKYGNLPKGVDDMQINLPPIMNGRDFLRDRFFKWSNRHFGSWVWGTVMSKKSIYERMGYFNPNYGFVSDVDMWMKIALEYDVGIVRGVHILLPPKNNLPHLFDDTNLQPTVRGIFLKNRIALARMKEASMTEQLLMHGVHATIQRLRYLASLAKNKMKI